MSESIRIEIGPVTLRITFSIYLNGREDINLLSKDCQTFEREFSTLHQALEFITENYQGSQP